MNVLRINSSLATDILVRFLREETGAFGFKKAVVGISGGVDSAVVCALAAKAFGAKNVLGVAMPYQSSDPLSEQLAAQHAKQLGIRCKRIDITPLANGYLEQIQRSDQVRKGNVLSRCRMLALYDLSAQEKALVIGTSNKTELLLGYGTLFGDMASAINPLGDLYKTQIYQLAQHLKIPAQITQRPPTADLWQGQTDEQELGFTYAEVDPLLFYLIDRRYTEQDLLARGFKREFIRKITTQVRRNHYKRRPPIIAKLSNRTINLDFRYLRDWGQ